MEVKKNHLRHHLIKLTGFQGGKNVGVLPTGKKIKIGGTRNMYEH